MGKVNKELWLLLSLVVIAAALNFLVSAPRMVLSFYFLPVLYSAYHFGRRHATLTAFASVFVVVLLTYLNPTLFSHHMAALDNNPWSDLTIWGGILAVTGYTMGTLYERNQRSLAELRDSYDGMLLILQQFVSSERFTQDHHYRVSVCATKIGECLGLDSDRLEDVRAAALLRNLKELGISNAVLYKAANLTQEEIEQGFRKGRQAISKTQAIGGSLRRALPILVGQKALAEQRIQAQDIPLEAHILVVADAYESLISGASGKRMSPTQAEEAIIRGSGMDYNTQVVNAFVKAFGQRAHGAGAGS